MSIESNKAVVRNFEEQVWNQRNPGKLGDFFSTKHAFRGPGVTMDFEGHKGMIAHFLSAFPDGVARSEDLVAEGDKVVQRWSFHGTHMEPFQAIPATGKAVVLTGIAIWRFEDGKIVESWHEMDNLGMLQQLGALPPTATNSP